MFSFSYNYVHNLFLLLLVITSICEIGFLEQYLCFAIVKENLSLVHTTTSELNKMYQLQSNLRNVALFGAQTRKIDVID